MRKSLTRMAAFGAAAVVGITGLAAAPAASAEDMGTTSLAAVLTSGETKFDRDYRDYDILTAAVLAVLEAKPNSPVGALADGSIPLTAFIPTDGAFKKLVKNLTGERPKSEAKTFETVAGLGIDTVETVLLYHVVPGATIDSSAAIAAPWNTKLPTALEGKVITVRVNQDRPSITLIDYNKKLPNAKVKLSQVDINKGNMQIAHGITEVMMPTK